MTRATVTGILLQSRIQGSARGYSPRFVMDSNCGQDTPRLDQGVPLLPEPAAWAELPLSSLLFGIWRASAKQAWHCIWQLARIETHRALPSLASRRLRSRTLKNDSTKCLKRWATTRPDSAKHNA